MLYEGSQEKQGSYLGTFTKELSAYFRQGDVLNWRWLDLFSLDRKSDRYSA